MIHIDPADPRWPREQIAAQLRAAIDAGEITGRLPSVRHIAQEAGVSAHTAQAAVDILRSEGIVYAVSGRGTFVA